MSSYCSVQDVRNFTNLPSAEYSDNQISFIISGVSDEIETRTGRVWSGVATQSNETYDGDGTDTLHLNRINIASITSLGIDDDKDGIFTTISSSNPQWYYWYPEGIIKLNTASSSVSVFTIGKQNVKVSYTYGYSSVPDGVTLLATLMVADFINPQESRKMWIERKVKELKAIGANLVS